ncbi:hypothetical protein, partial [Reyranella sp.]|uniref:hypothetical protein n=1 Tax=Reyranella sp. TaxID=1929291 RepID=UPI00273095AD
STREAFDVGDHSFKASWYPTRWLDCSASVVRTVAVKHVFDCADWRMFRSSAEALKGKKVG